MTDSIFRRINREDYRREMIRYLQSSGYHPARWMKYRGKSVHSFSSNQYTRQERRSLRPWLLCLVLTALYGLCLPLLHNNKEWFGVITSWTSPWLEDQLKVYVPSINKVSENLVERGSSDLVPLAQHTYSMGILFGVMVFIAACFRMWAIRATSARVKRVYLVQCISGGKKMFLLPFLGLGVLLFLGFKFLYTGILDGGDVEYYQMIRILLFNHTTWASFVILFFSGGCAFLLAGSIMMMYCLLKIWYINIKLSIKQLKIMQRSKTAE